MSEQRRDDLEREVHAALEARKELGPEMEPAIVDAWAALGSLAQARGAGGRAG